MAHRQVRRVTKDAIIAGILRMVHAALGEIIDLVEGREVSAKRVAQTWASVQSALAKAEAEERRKKRKEGS